MRSLNLNDLGPLPGRPEVTEGKYRFLARLDYIDADENAVSTYETLYGFFWLNTAEGYAIIQARQPDVLKALRRRYRARGQHPPDRAGHHQTVQARPEVSPGRGASLGPAARSEPRPADLPLADHRGRRPLREGLPGLGGPLPRSAQRALPDLVANEKETVLTVRCEQGALSLAGAVPASLFRSWCLDSLGQLLAVHRSFQANASAYVPTLDLANKPGARRSEQRRKEAGPGDHGRPAGLEAGGRVSDLQPLDIDPLALAADLTRFVTAQIPWECPEPGCGEQGYLPMRRVRRDPVQRQAPG